MKVVYTRGPKAGSEPIFGDELWTKKTETVKYRGFNGDRVYVDRGDAYCSYEPDFLFLAIEE